jgi:hypothetical protein
VLKVNPEKNMAHFKLNEEAEKFLSVPEGATLIFAGTDGTETWIERKRDTIVRISMKSVAVALSDAGVLQACIEIGGASAKGLDGPLPIEAQLRVSQSVQVLVKAGERLAFKAYPTTREAQLQRTVVWTSDFEQEPEHRADDPRRALANAGSPDPQAPH